jgi:hypothetical protein
MNGKFEDAWKKAHPNKPGFTCCQDQNLLNAASKLNHRIDLILFRSVRFRRNEASHRAAEAQGRRRLPMGTSGVCLGVQQ